MQKKVLTVALSFLITLTYAQDDLLSMLDTTTGNESALVFATFKGTRVINLHSVENPAPGELRFLISHRFGALNSGGYEFFGLDQATIRLAFEYGITKKLAVGIGRSKLDKNYDASVKYKFLRQSTGKNAMPVTLVGMTGLSYVGLRYSDDRNATQKLIYYTQAIVGRKFSDAFSLQISPTWIHYNLVPLKTDDNDAFSVAFAARHKLTQRVSINAEYIYLLPGTVAEQRTNSLSVGFDLETGGHIFQLHFTNSQGMIENQFVAENTGKWSKGDIFFGFNIYRSFTINKNN
jgi:hypothetical protein